VNGIDSPKVFEIDIKSGWKEGDVHHVFNARDIMFIVCEKPHIVFK
jgi:hypothetical protein